MTGACETAMEKLPSHLADTVRNDGYDSVEAWIDCFGDEAQLERYFKGLVFVRRAFALEGLTEDNISFSVPMGGPVACNS